MTRHGRFREVRGGKGIALHGKIADTLCLIYSHHHGRIQESEDNVNDLEAMHLKPRGLGMPVEDTSTTDFEAEDRQDEQVRDPTDGLPPVIMSEAWRDKGPPPRGAGWWGRGAPVQVQAGHTVRDIEDGLGLCSPGRWRPRDRRLPNLGSLAGGFYKALELDEEE